MGRTKKCTGEGRLKRKNFEITIFVNYCKDLVYIQSLGGICPAVWHHWVESPKLIEVDTGYIDQEY